MGRELGIKSVAQYFRGDVLTELNLSSGAKRFKRATVFNIHKK